MLSSLNQLFQVFFLWPVRVTSEVSALCRDDGPHLPKLSCCAKMAASSLTMWSRILTCFHQQRALQWMTHCFTASSPLSGQWCRFSVCRAVSLVTPGLWTGLRWISGQHPQIRASIQYPFLRRVTMAPLVCMGVAIANNRRWWKNIILLFLNQSLC